jgi:hypothetical protein
MIRKLAKIYTDFDGKLIGTQKMKNCICDTLSRMPTDIAAFITEHCWFIGSMDDAWALTFRGNEIKESFLIFLSDDLLAQNKAQIRHSIAHEIGHVILNHRNSILVRQSKAEIRKQEKEAEEFASRYD